MTEPKDLPVIIASRCHPMVFVLRVAGAIRVLDDRNSIVLVDGAAYRVVRY